MLRPLTCRVLVRPDEWDIADPVYESAKKAGIVLQKDKREQEAVVKGTVLAIGKTAFHAPVGDGTPEVVVGSRVYYAKYAGTKVIDPETDEELLGLNDEDLVFEITGE